MVRLDRVNKHRAQAVRSSGQGSGGRWVPVTLWVIVGLMAVASVAFLVDYLATRNDVPRGAQVGGVAIGGLSHAEAEAKLDSELGELALRPVTVRADDMQSRFTPAQAGISPDWAQTVAAAGEQSANPLQRLRGLLTTYEVEIVSAADDSRFQPAVKRVREALSRDPHDGAVRIEDGTIATDDPLDGQTVDPGELADQMLARWADPDGVSVDTVVVSPTIDGAVMDQAIKGPAEKALSDPVVARGREDSRGTIPVERMGEVLRFEPHEGELDPIVDPEAARNLLAEGLGPGEKPAQNAQITFSGGKRSVTPDVAGEMVDWEATLDGIAERIIGDKEREFDASYRDEPATFTAEMADNATFDEVVGEFTTTGFSATSGANIRRVADQVDGAVVSPGDTFSLNGYTGPRGTAQGYVEGGIIIDGHAGTAVGGGISQFATTLYNATYFAGMEDVEHTPHSYYINRYPAGREATVYEGAIDLAFKNGLNHPVRIETEVGKDSVTVRLTGVKEVEVESINGGRWARTEPRPQHVGGPDCSPSGGAPGFTTSDTRVVRDLSGHELSRETTTTVYDPQPIVQCG